MVSRNSYRIGKKWGINIRKCHISLTITQSRIMTILSLDFKEWLKNLIRISNHK
jgi:hypothetical protein